MTTSDSAPSGRRWANEDWLAVATGLISVGLVLLGWRPWQPDFRWESAGDLARLFGLGNVRATVLLAGALLALALPAMAWMGANALRFAAGFLGVFGLAWLSQAAAGQAQVKYLGIEYVIFGLAAGLLVNHLIRIPHWLREAVRTEFYIKTGLVILGGTILFRELLQAGALGLVQALVWYAAYWLARRLRVDEELGVMMASAVAICGVSAAIAACGAIQGDRRKLSYVTSLVLIVAVPMMIGMPWLARIWGLPDLVAGAWLGGTLDTSGSVVAAGQLISETATKAGVIVKFSQNVLIGVAAFVLSVWWAMRGTQGAAGRPTARVIWDRFPKFVLGFMATSLVFSFALEPSLVAETKPALNGLRNFWFALAFVSIGLETHFGELVRMDSGRPAVVFITAQAFNVVWTLVLAWLLFGGVLMPVPDLG